MEDALGDLKTSSLISLDDLPHLPKSLETLRSEFAKMKFKKGEVSIIDRILQKSVKFLAEFHDEIRHRIYRILSFHTKLTDIKSG